MFRLKTSTACTALAVILTAHAAIASAATTDTETRIVRFADLDIEHAPGAATLYSRIAIAARQVCEFGFSTWQMDFARDANVCWKQSVDRAVREINSPALTSYYEQKSPSIGGRR